MIKIVINEAIGEVEQFTFPGGEVQIRIPEEPTYSEDLDSGVIVHADIKNSDDVIALLLSMSVLRETLPNTYYALFLRYFPYARQDRACQPREAFSLKVFADLINSLEFSYVAVWDFHNEDLLHLIDNVIHTSQEILVEDLATNYKTLVSPDKGASKKIKVFEKSHNIIVGEKIRDVATGEILKTEVHYKDCDKSEPILIIDDICDGGRTFIELAKVLKSEGFTTIDLYVTHGIFSKGREVFDGLIRDVYTANNFNKVV